MERKMEGNELQVNHNTTSYFRLSKYYCIKGTLMADEGNLNEALENYNKAIEVNPENHIAYYNRATIKIDLGDFEGAKNDFFSFDKIKK